MIRARLEWKSGESVMLRNEQGEISMVPAYDPVLEDFVTKHDHGIPESAFVNGDVIRSWAVDQDTWNAMDVVSKIKGELQAETGKWYEDRDEYRNAAVTCYNAHGNPDLSKGCPDYLHDSKRIGVGTYKVDGREIVAPPPLRQYLCYLCPFQQAYVQVELRRRRGGYDLDKALAYRKRMRKQKALMDEYSQNRKSR